MNLARYLFSFFYFSALITFTRQVEYLVSQDFTNPNQSSTSGWSLNTIYQCTSSSKYVDWFGNQNFNGVLQADSQQKTFNQLLPHWSLSLRFDLLLYGAVDQSSGEQIQIFIDGNLQDTFTKNSEDGDVICYNILWYVSHNDELILYQRNITHNSNSVTVQLLPQTSTYLLNRGFGFKNFYLYVDTCDYSCASCNGPTKNQCLTCPTNSVKSGSSCTCSTGYYQHQYSCVSSCPTGFVKSNTSNTCVADNSINCQTYNSSTQLCTSCKSNYFLYQGQCLLSCPQTSSVVSNTCVDYSTALINGQYLLNGLFTSYFGQSEITGLGLTVSNFKGFKSNFGSSGALTTNCGTNHVLGGFWLSGSTASISRVWNGLAPHWSIRIDYTVWKIDQWNNEYFYVNVDGQVKQSVKFASNSGTSNLCGYDSFNDQQSKQTVNITHSSSTLNLMFSNSFTSDVRQESFALSNIFVLVDFCTSNCLACNASGCTACQASYFLYNSVCVLSCPTTTYLSNPTTCVDCSSNCQTCNTSSTFCTSCYSPNYLIQSSGTCVATCPVSSWVQTSNRTCQPCDSSCYTCNNPGNQSSCTSCNGTKYLNNNQCVSTCPNGTYPNTVTNNNQCLQCNSQCSTCNGPNSNNCLSCNLPSYFQQSSSTCVSSCNSNQYGDNTQIKCINCDPTCATCSGSSTNCQSCSGSLFLSTTGNTCTSSCLTNQFKNTSNNKCTPCDSTCTTCNGSNNNNCLSCSGSLFFNTVTKTCNSTCPNGTYPNPTGNVCSQCDSTCATCNGSSNSNCLSCTYPTRYLQPSTSQCVTSCQSNQYANSYSPPTCQNCDTSCKTCSGTASNNCLSCQGGLFLSTTGNICSSSCQISEFQNTANNQCTPCDSTCLTCSGNLSNQCLSCQSPRFFQASSNTCVLACNSNQYSQTSPVPVCKNCDSSCATCSGSANTNCLTCSGSKFLDSTTNQCVSTCPNGTYKNISNNKCSPCDPTCTTCNGPNNYQCLSCTLPKYYQSSTGKCVDNCNSNQYQDNSSVSCQNCDSTCASCSGGAQNNCLSCSGSLFLSTTGNVCTNNCQTNEFKNTNNNKCTPCDSSCSTCSGPSNNNCLSCSGSLYFNSVNKTCQSTCPDGTYPNSTGNICSQCDSTCATCNGGNSTNCQSCTYPSRYFQPSTFQCVTQCNTNQYANSSSPPTCQNCDPTCQTCSGIASNNCLSCSGNLYLSTSGNTCTASCQSSEFQNTSNNKCTLCDSSCFTCSGSQPNNCLSCQSPSFFQPSSKTCVLNCNTNQYSQTSPTPLCLDCDSSCASCSGPSKTNCLSCSGSTFLDSKTNQCVTTCPDGTYQNTNNNKCTPCDPTCTTCNGPSNNQCLTCTLPKYFQTAAGQCVDNCNTNQYQDNPSATCLNCNSNCASCSGGAQNNCLSCSGSLFLDLNANTCVSNCPKSYYQNLVNNQCSKCNSSCTTCNGGQINNCLSCTLPLYFEPATNTCVSSCLAGQYMDSQTDTCLNCDSTCSTCTKGGLNGCSSCVIPLYYQASSSSCVQNCQLNQYQDNSTATCSSCDGSCASCSGPGKNECLSCSGSLYFDSTTKKCVNICPDSYFADQSTNICKKCDPSCKTCNGNLSTNCQSCTLPLYFNPNNQKCVSDCDQNQYKENTNAQCLACDSSCLTCSGSLNSQCLSCSSNFYLYQNMCQSSCPDGYYKNIQNNTCSKCDSSCLTCSGSSPTDCLKCALPKYFQQTTNSCESACNQNQYPDSSDATCKLCDSSCSSCNGPSSSQCQTCSGSKFLYQNQCDSACPDGFFKDASNNKCSQCASSCKTCTSANSCSSCQPPLINYNNTCIQTCPSGFYSQTLQNQCQPCFSTCSSCSGPSATECLGCPQGTFLKGSTCVNKCGDGYYLSQDKCSQCHPSCKNCQGPNQDQCIECPDILFKYNSKCLSDCPQGTYQEQQSQKQCFSCSSSCSTGCNGPSEKNCNNLKPQNQIIVYILSAKTVIWVISSIVGIIQDQKNKKSQILTVVPKNTIEKKFDFDSNDSPITRKRKKVFADIYTQNITMNDSPIQSTKQNGLNDNYQLPSFAQNEGLQPQFDSQQTQLAGVKDGNTKSEVNLQTQTEKSPKNSYNRRRPRKSQFILNINQKSMNALSSQVNIIDSSPITTKRNQDQSVVTSAVSPFSQSSRNLDKPGKSENQKYLANEKLKYSFLGNEWIELFAFYDPYVKRACRITLIYLKYHMFFFICEYFKFSPEYYLSVCLASGLSMKFIIEKILYLMTKYTNFGNLLSMILFLGALGADFWYWFIPKIQSVNYNMDYSWSFQYLITFSADFLILQQLLGLIKYLSTVKFMNLKTPNSISSGLKNQYFVKNIQK